MIKRLNPTAVREVPSAFAGIYTHATQLDAPKRLVALSGQIGVSLDGTVSEQFATQCHVAMDHVEALVAANDMQMSNIMRLTYYLTRADDLPELTRLRQERWHSQTPPAITTLVVAGLASADLLIEIEALLGA